MEPQLKASCNAHLADCLLSGFRMNQFANGLEQLMTLLIQVVGAYSLPPQNSTLCPDRDAVPRDR